MMLYGFLYGILALISVVVGRAQVKPMLVDCGSNLSTSIASRRWVGDFFPSDNFTLSYSGTTASTDSTTNGKSGYSTLYKTARIFNTTSTYNFSMVPGNYIIRLHFYPFDFEKFNVNQSAFDVVANNLNLISKCNVPAEIAWKNMQMDSISDSLVKEYFLNISLSMLSVKFIPASRSFAFVNAIEVIPIVNDFFRNAQGLKSPLNLFNKGMETMYRLNVGGPEIDSSQDQELWRKWQSDETFMFFLNAASNISNSSNISYASLNDSITAPLEVYETARIMTNNQVMEKKFNMSWKFIVDPNFDYLVRLHFCELFYNKADQRTFRIFINNKTAAENYEIYKRAGGMNKAYHEDYVDSLSPQVDTLWLQLGPNSLTSGADADALLNGLEIFKLSRNGNLAHPPERLAIGGRSVKSGKAKNITLWVGIGAGFASVLAVAICATFICLFCRKKRMTPHKCSSPSWVPLSLYGMIGSTTNARKSRLPINANVAGRRFTLPEMRAATKNFDESLVIGIGGFGKVYKGNIEDGILVAIKRANPESEQGLAEFETEIEMLSKLRHRHLVSLIGYCDERGEMILVYEYMANGTLRSHLFGSDHPPLTWKQRLEICIGAARGLHYLHTGAERGIIHRDVKTTNILLDDKFVAKVSDFGLSKDGPAIDRTHVSTAVKGSFGYLDPEYYRRQQLTQTSDVYSFGVVLFEVVCARPVINPSLPRDQINLAEWALKQQKQQELETIVDQKLEGDYSLESLNKFGDIAEKCLADEGKDRPTMGEVLWHLEYALQLHEACIARSSVNPSKSDVTLANMSVGLPLIKENEDITCRESSSSDGSDAEDEAKESKEVFHNS